MNEAWRAIMIAAVATALALASYFSFVALVAFTFVLVLALAIGWPMLVAIPAARGSALVLALTGIGGILAVLLVHAEPALRWLPVALGGGVILAFVQQMLRLDGRGRLVETVSGVTAGMLVAISTAGWIAAADSVGGQSLVVASAVGLAGASAAAAAPVRGWFGAFLTLATGTAAGSGVGAVMPLLSVQVGLLIGLMAGILIASLRSLFAHLPNAGRWPAALASVTLPVSASGIAIYIIGRVLIG